MEDLEKAGYLEKNQKAQVFLEVLGTDQFQEAVNQSAGEALELLRDVVLNGQKEETQVKAAKTLLDLAMNLNDTLAGRDRGVPQGPTLNVFVNSSDTIKSQLRQAADQVTYATKKVRDAPRAMLGLPPLGKDPLDD
jgi:hypothetical protein